MARWLPPAAIVLPVDSITRPPNSLFPMIAMTESLKIEDLHVSVEGKPILKGVSLTLRRGEVHALMGPNGSGKSTLGFAAMGHPNYEVTQGSITIGGDDLLARRDRPVSYEIPFVDRVWKAVAPTFAFHLKKIDAAVVSKVGRSDEHLAIDGYTVVATVQALEAKRVELVENQTEYKVRAARLDGGIAVHSHDI